MRAILAIFALSAILVPPPCGAADPGETAVTLSVGELMPVGPAPVRQAICDDSTVAQVVDASGGPALKGVGPGKTLCSFVDAVSFRQVLRVTVVPVPGPPTEPPPPAY